MVEQQQVPIEGEEQLMQELRRLEQSARNYQQEVSIIKLIQRKLDFTQ